MFPLFVTLWKAEANVSVLKFSGMQHLLIPGTAWGDIRKNKWLAFDMVVAVVTWKGMR